MSQPYIVGAMVVAVADTALSGIINEGNRVPPMRVIVGGWAVTVGLLVLADNHDAFASAMATLILLATLAGPNNDGLFKSLGNAVGYTASGSGGSGGRPVVTR